MIFIVEHLKDIIFVYLRDRIVIFVLHLSLVLKYTQKEFQYKFFISFLVIGA